MQTILFHTKQFNMGNRFNIMTQGQITSSDGQAQPPLTSRADTDASLGTVCGLQAAEINCVNQFKMQPDVFDSENKKT